jgi:hypothetical protein
MRLYEDKLHIKIIEAGTIYNFAIGKFFLFETV